MAKAFILEKRVELYHVDGANIVFYGHIFSFVHDAFAEFLRSKQFSIAQRLELKDIFFPVVHAQADYIEPLRLDDFVQIEINRIEVKNKSFSVFFRLSVNGAIRAEAKVIHACICAKEQKSILVGDTLKSLLQSSFLDA